MALCVAIFDREDSLISLKLKEKRFNSDVTATQIQHFLHNSYDIIIDKINNPSAKTNQDLFIGTLLLSTSFRSHGYLTNTGVKFVLVSDAENNAIKDQEIRIFFKKLHSIYCNALSNPFYKIGSQLNSRSVDKAMKDFFDSF